MHPRQSRIEFLLILLFSKVAHFCCFLSKRLLLDILVLYMLNVAGDKHFVEVIFMVSHFLALLLNLEVLLIDPFVSKLSLLRFNFLNWFLFQLLLFLHVFLMTLDVGLNQLVLFNLPKRCLRVHFLKPFVVRVKNLLFRLLIFKRPKRLRLV